MSGEVQVKNHYLCLKHCSKIATNLLLANSHVAVISHLESANLIAVPSIMISLIGTKTVIVIRITQLNIKSKMPIIKMPLDLRRVNPNLRVVGFSSNSVISVVSSSDVANVMVRDADGFISDVINLDFIVVMKMHFSAGVDSLVRVTTEHVGLRNLVMLIKVCERVLRVDELTSVTSYVFSSDVISAFKNGVARMQS